MKISDTIENFILDIMGEDGSCNICRNELASYFHCAPSQINYCLNTRFTAERGYKVESQRGGGGFVKIEKVDSKNLPYLESILGGLTEPIAYTRAKQIIMHLIEEQFISECEGNIMLASISERALSAPSNIADIIRRNILRESIIEIIKRGKYEISC